MSHDLHKMWGASGHGPDASVGIAKVGVGSSRGLRWTQPRSGRVGPTWGDVGPCLGGVGQLYSDACKMYYGQHHGTCTNIGSFLTNYMWVACGPNCGRHDTSFQSRSLSRFWADPRLHLPNPGDLSPATDACCGQHVACAWRGTSSVVGPTGECRCVQVDACAQPTRRNRSHCHFSLRPRH